MYNMNKPYPKVGDIILYTVNKGDNVFRIAQMFDTTTELIKCMNNLKDDYFIQINQQLLIPVLYHQHPHYNQHDQYRQSYDLYF